MLGTDLRRGQITGDASRRWVHGTAVSYAYASATYAPLASPTFTGDPKAPTPAPGDNDTSIATTAFVHTAVAAGGTITGVTAGTGLNGGGTTGVVTLNLTAPVLVANGGTGATTAAPALANLGGAPLASPTFTGTPAAPTPTAGNSTTQLATTAFVATSFAPLASPALTGNPTATTQLAADNSTRIATTAYVKTVTQSKAATQSSPANPAGTSSTTYVMVGLAGTITPAVSGKVLLMISGSFTTSLSGAGGNLYIAYGTGTAPANGAAAVGTVLGTFNTLTTTYVGGFNPISLQGVVTGLTLGVAVWFDIAMETRGGGTFTMFAPNLSAVEI